MKKQNKKKIYKKRKINNERKRRTKINRIKENRKGNI